MATHRKVSDLLGSRRDVLRLGGLGLLGASLDSVWPLRVSSAGETVSPRGNARQVVFFEINGAISHIESFDFKESEGMPADLDVREVYPGLYLPHTLFPRLEGQMDKIAILRSLRSHEEVHFRAQYYVQTGRQNNLAIAKEKLEFLMISEVSTELSDSLRRFSKIINMLCPEDENWVIAKEKPIFLSL